MAVPQFIRGEGDDELPCYFGKHHPGQSCTGVEHEYHIVLTRQLSDGEWNKYSNRCDAQAWDAGRKTWNIEGIAAVLHDITGEKDIIFDIEIPREGEWISLKR